MQRNPEINSAKKYWKFGLMMCCLLTLSSGILVSERAFAQEKKPSDGASFEVKRVAIIDLARIIRESEATARVRNLLDGKSAEFQQEFAEKEQQLLTQERELKARKDLISEEAYQEEVRAFQRDVAKIQQDIQNKRQSLDRALQEAQDKIRNLATKIIAERASELNLDLVFKEDQLLIFRNQLDITEDILARLNERTKDAQLEISEQTSPKGQ